MSQGATECLVASVEELVAGVDALLWRSNALMVLNAVLVAIMLVVGALGPHHRRNAMTRLLFLGASTLYLPIVSSVTSSIGQESCTASGGLDVFCHGRSYVALLLIWTVLVQIVGTSTSVIIATDDSDDSGQKLGPTIQLLSSAAWSAFLVFYYSRRGFRTAFSRAYGLESTWYYKNVAWLLIVLCLLSLSKIMLRLYAFWKGRNSFALGRNSSLIAGQMVGNLQGSSPELLVMGEDKQEVVETPKGYRIRQQRSSSLLIFDVDSQQASVNGYLLLNLRPSDTDLCLSFGLFKLLKRLFAKAYIDESGSVKAFDFVLKVLLNNGSSERAFNVVADEISFILDSYYSSLPTCYFGRLLPILNATISIFIIAWCLIGGTYISNHFSVSAHPNQMFCRPNPMSCKIPPQYLNDKGVRIVFGNIQFNTIPTLGLAVAVIAGELWEIVSYLCSNWFKVAMLYNYITHASWQKSPLVKKCLHLLLKLKLRRSWRDHMGQRSLLPARQQPRCVRMSRLLYWFSEPTAMWSVKVSSKVKEAIVITIRGSNGTLSKGTNALQHSRIGRGFLWACKLQGTSDVILIWHIANEILEARTTSSQSTNRLKAIATPLSRYCAFLVATAPDLLPDDKAWSKKQYETVSREIQGALVGDPVDHGGMVARLLDEWSENEVVNNGLILARQLMEQIDEGQEAAVWTLLVSFWSEILVYIATSDNVKAHKKAIAHNIELVTLIWAMLSHAGITTRPSTRGSS